MSPLSLLTGLLAAHTLVEAGRQGILVWVLREHVPPRRQDWLNASLHAGGLALYALVVGAGGWVVLGPQTGWAGWAGWAALAGRAVLVRGLLFDPALLLTRNYYNYREGRAAESLLHVGTTAATDRLLRAAAQRLGLRVEYLKAGLTLCHIALAAYWFTR